MWWSRSGVIDAESSRGRLKVLEACIKLEDGKKFVFSREGWTYTVEQHSFLDGRITRGDGARIVWGAPIAVLITCVEQLLK